jgi:bleomycin hydrolase
MLRSRTLRIVLLTAATYALITAPAAAQGRQRVQSTPKTISSQQAFYDAIHAPNYLGTDIAHTSIKRQLGGTCWNFATVSFLESEVLRTNEEVTAWLRENRKELDLSEYYVVYWAWVEKAREYVKRHGENARLSDGGVSHDTIEFVRKYGIVPESAFAVPDSTGPMTRQVTAAIKETSESSNWNEAAVVRAARAVLDRHLAPIPASFEWAGKTWTPKQWADEYLKLDYDNYWEITSYLDFPFYTRGELDIPDNWWDCKGYYNVPLDAYLRIINRALDQGYSVAVDTDWGDSWSSQDRTFRGDVGSGFGTHGLAVIHPDMTSGLLIGQDTRQTDFEERRTTDDHLIHAVDHRIVDGRDWYLIKNSHGTAAGRQGYVWMRDDWMAMRVLAIMVHKNAIDPLVVRRFEGGR